MSKALEGRRMAPPSGSVSTGPSPADPHAVSALMLAPGCAVSLPTRPLPGRHSGTKPVLHYPLLLCDLAVPLSPGMPYSSFKRDGLFLIHVQVISLCTLTFPVSNRTWALESIFISKLSDCIKFDLCSYVLKYMMFLKFPH